MVCQRYGVAVRSGESGMAQLACGCFDPVPVAQRSNIDMVEMQRDAIAHAQIAAEIGPRIGIRTDAMVDMQGGKPPFEAGRKRVQQMQQHDRIHAAAQADQYMTARGKQRRETRRNGVS